MMEDAEGQPADLARAEQAQRRERVQLLVDELEEVHAAVGALLRATEREFGGARSRAKDPDERAWGEAQQVLRKARATADALLRREANVLSLYAADCGVQVNASSEDRREPSLRSPGNPLPPPPRSSSSGSPPRSLAPMPDVPRVDSGPPQTASAARAGSPSMLSPTSSLVGSPPSGDGQRSRAAWEARILKKIAIRLREKRRDALSAGKPVARIDADLAKIERELAGFASDETGAASSADRPSQSPQGEELGEARPHQSQSDVRRIPTSVASSSWATPTNAALKRPSTSAKASQLDWSISPVQEAPDATPRPRGFEDMISKIAAGQTPTPGRGSFPARRPSTEREPELGRSDEAEMLKDRKSRGDAPTFPHVEPRDEISFSFKVHQDILELISTASPQPATKRGLARQLF